MPRKKKKTKRLFRPSEPSTPWTPALRVAIKPSASRAIEGLENQPIPETIALWRSALRMSECEDAKNREEAKKVIVAIENDWARRSRLVTGYFQWPSTEVAGGDGNLDGRRWEDQGFLKFIGYNVGFSADLGPVDRQLILSRSFEGTIPPFSSMEYILEWGDPKTGVRLRKIANVISSLTRSAKRRRFADMSRAISDWESDLLFLYERFYVAKFGFGWPSTNN